MEPLCGRGHRLEFTLAGGDGPDYPGEFVGDSNRGFVVSPRAVDLPRPGAELVGRALADVGHSEHGASALREERTEVGVATLGDAPEAANVTTGVLFGNEAALLHGPEQIADLPVPVAESPGAVRIGHPERSHLVEYLAPNSVFNSLPRQRSSPHLRPDDRLVTIDRVLHHASLGVA